MFSDKEFKGAQKGTVVHFFMEHVSFTSSDSAKKQADDMLLSGILSQEEYDALPMDQLENFMNSFDVRLAIDELKKVDDYEFEEEIEYHIVGATEIDIAQGKISLESPVGKALYGKQKGDDVEVQVPDGINKYKILDIKKSV